MSYADRQQLYTKIDDWEQEILRLLGSLLPKETRNIQEWTDSRLQLLAGLKQKIASRGRKLGDEIIPWLTQNLGDRDLLERELRGYIDVACKQFVRRYQKAVQDTSLWSQLDFLAFSEALRNSSDALADAGAIGRIDGTRRYSLREAIETAVEAAYSLERIEAVLMDPEAEYVEVSAHYGARPSHAEWQGGIYKIHGSTPQYPNLAVVTGYGTPKGLGGYGCRHYIWLFIPGVSTKHAINVDLALNAEIYDLRQKENRHRRKAAQWLRRETVAMAQYDGEAASRYKIQKQYHREQVRLLEGIIAKAMPI